MIEYIIICVLFVFVCLQGWWIYKSLNKFLLMRDLYSEVGETVSNYVEHLNKVHGMERFYGEPVLEQLVEHGKETVEVLEGFIEVFADFEENGDLALQNIYDNDNEEEQINYGSQT